MADRDIENTSSEVPEIPELVENLLLYVLDEGKEKMAQSGELVPFSALAVKDNLFLESHPADSVEACFAEAQKTVQGARGADAYAFCYDGYVETDEGERDIVIAEGGLPGEEDGYAVGYLYTVKEDGSYEFDEDPAYIGPAPNFMSSLKAAIDYGEDEVDPRFAQADEADL